MTVYRGTQKKRQLSGARQLAYCIKVYKHIRVLLTTTYINTRTKSTTRYHTPDIKRKLQERERCKETLEVEAQKAFLAFLTQIAQSCYGVMRSAVNNLAIVDCLFSLAQVALQQGYVRPEFTDESVLEIVEGARCLQCIVPLKIDCHYIRSSSYGRSA